MTVEHKVIELKKNLSVLPGLAVAYSGGADSTFLLKTAGDVLGEKVTAVTIASCLLPQRELKAARDFCALLKVKHIIIETNPLQIPGFSTNPTNRCYLCKSRLFAQIKETAQNSGIERIADGSNRDDLNDFRPGLRALKELGILTPLLDAGLGKDEIRRLSFELRLPSWDKPAAACLASRFPYGEGIDLEKLSLVEKAEDYLLELGFKQVRVRVHGDLARIELGVEERSKIAAAGMMDRINDSLRALGFAYATLDLGGYRSGCFNPVEIIKKKP